jgi:hypothetical protein
MQSLKNWFYTSCPMCGCSGYVYDNERELRCGACEGTGLIKVPNGFYLKDTPKPTQAITTRTAYTATWGEREKNEPLS